MAYTLSIALDYIEPAVWRLIRIPGDCYLARLHLAIQGAMGWTNTHLHMFVAGDGTIFSDGRPRVSGARDEAAVAIREVLPAVGDTLAYIYDFGDRWRHTIEVEAIDDQIVSEVVCVNGARACPPEDVGGPPGYVEYLEAIFSPVHPEHDRMKGWFPNFDPSRFDLEHINETLRIALS
jgi:hypothetical protein